MCGNVCKVSYAASLAGDHIGYGREIVEDELCVIKTNANKDSQFKSKKLGLKFTGLLLLWLLEKYDNQRALQLFKVIYLYILTTLQAHFQTFYQFRL